MANTQAPFGFRPIKTGGVPYSGAFSTLKAQPTAAALNRGDMVTQLADGTVKVYAPADGHLARGVYIGCHYLSAALGYPIWSNYWPGSGALGTALIDVFIIDDPTTVFEVAALAGPITQADVGMRAEANVLASTTGFSKWSLTGLAVTATLPWIVTAVGNAGVPISDGYDATTAFNIVEVAWNDMFLKTGLGV
jgi:hypothetical protein